MNDGRQQEQDERLQREEPFSDYWAKREQDRRNERDFWAKWDQRWNVEKSWPFR